jgi:hypothetical protein
MNAFVMSYLYSESYESLSRSSEKTLVLLCTDTESAVYRETRFD